MKDLYDTSMSSGPEMESRAPTRWETGWRGYVKNAGLWLGMGLAYAAGFGVFG